MNEIRKSDSEKNILNVDGPQNRDSDQVLKINFDRDHVDQGSKVTGHILVNFAKSLPEDVTLKISGVSSIKLPTDYGKTYSSKETHLYEKLCLFNKRTTQELEIKTQGFFQFPFEFFVPDSAPPSFKGQQAKMVYACTVSVKFSDILVRKQSATREFDVSPTEPVALDLEGGTPGSGAEPMTLTKSFRPFSLMGPAGYLEITVQTDRVTLDRKKSSDIKLMVQVKNRSRFNWNNLNYGIVQVEKSSVKKREILQKIILMQFESASFALKPNQSWSSKKIWSFADLKTNEKSINHPFVPPSIDFQSAKFQCKLSYYIFVTLIPSGFGKICELYYPLVVI